MTTNVIASEQAVKEYYSETARAEQYVEDRFVHPLYRILHQQQIAVVQAGIKEVSPKRVLEVAPGPGRLTAHLKDVPGLVCVEFNEAMIKIGRERAPWADWRQGDAFHLDFNDEFDLLYTFRFIRHFRRDDRRRLLANLARALKPGGLLIFDAVNAKVSLPLRAAAPSDYPVYDELYDSIDDLRAELSEHGFAVVKTVPVQKRLSLQLSIGSILGPRIPSLANRLVAWLERLPGGEPLEWVVVAKKL